MINKGDYMDRKLTVKEMKEICRDIFNKESQEHNLDLVPYPVTIIGYYTDFLKKMNYSLIKHPGLITLPSVASGACITDDDADSIVIFLKSVRRIIDTKDKMSWLVEVCFHEIYHAIQRTFDKYSYDNFLNRIGHYNGTHLDYRLKHDNYSFEIGANLYSITKTREYLKENYPEVYESEKEYLDSIEKEYIYDYLSYDPVNSVDRSIAKLRKDHKKIDDIGSKYDKISPILGIFLNDDVEFKSMSEIINDEKFKKLDNRTIAAFFSSKAFLEEVDMSKLSTQELGLIKEAIEYTKTMYNNQSKLLDKTKFLNEESVEYLRIKRTLLTRSAALAALFIKKTNNAIGNTINKARNEKARIEHANNMDFYLEKTKEQINNKSRGFLSISICYLLGFIISTATIIYFLLVR
jgi:hypothetical protein